MNPALALVTAVALAVTPAPATPASSLNGAHWLWYPEGNPAASAPTATRFLRRTFSAPSTDGRLVVAGDDTVDVWLNGTHLARSRPQQLSTMDLGGALKTGSNTLVLAARNGGGPAGVLGRVTIPGTADIVTDGSWQASREVDESLNGTWTAARDLGAYGIAPWRRSIRPGVQPPPEAAVGLTTERQTTPIGVDAAKPRFGWQLTSGTQGRYQIQVRSRPGATPVWDSGRVAGAQSVDVTYGGPALTANHTYLWRVRVWDTLGRPGPWSANARFDTGVDPWNAAFIGATSTATVDGANWIWYPEGDPAVSVPAATRYFRRTFSAATAGRATLTVTGDDTADVWVNGTQVSTSRRAVDSWKRASTAEVDLRAGANTIAIAATNTTAGPAGLLARLGTVVTDGSWVSSQTAPGGWQQPGFNDSAWPAVRVTAAYGGGPWGRQVVVPNPAPYLRKGFSVDRNVSRARLFTTALGLHDTYLNGVRVGDQRLDPGWTDYTKRLQYRGYDVTAQLKRGTNALSAVIGNGWYSGSLGFAGSQRYGTQPWYSAQLLIDYADGTTATVATDGSWLTAPGDIRADDLYAGEDQDARAGAPSNWVPVTVSTAVKPQLVAAIDPGVTVQQEISPVAITQPRPGVFVADLGQNFAGWNRLRVRGPAGTRVTLRHAEILDADGTIYTANLRAAQATDSFTLAGTGADEVFEPRFTVHGYRYVEITGFPGTPTAANLTGLAAWTDGAETGTFTSSDPLVNQLQHNIVWGARSNLLSIPTDCPQRDERLGWTGDIAAFAATSTFNFDTHGLLDKFTTDLTDAQHSDGAFTDVAPDVLGGAGKAGWGDAGVIVPYQIWQKYGDLSPADRSFAAMARWVDYLRSTAGADLIRDHETYGDWLNVDDNTPNDLTSTAYFGWSARLVSRMAAATGRTASATEYGDLADRIAAAFTARFVGADGTVGTNSQTGYVLALAFGLVPSGRTQAVADKLAAKVASRNGHLSVGFMGVEGLLPVLAEHGHLDTAYQVLQQPGYPGWGYMNSRGATTIWERWDGIRTDGSLQDPGMNSFNHYGLGSVGDWLYRTVGGVAPATPGYQQVLIEPQPGGTLTEATSDLETAYGRVRSAWTESGGKLTLQTTIAPNTTGIVRIPASSTALLVPSEAVPLSPGSYFVPPGTYTFTANTAS